MNTSHRSIWNSALGAWVAVSEITRARGKRSGASVALAGSGVLALGLLLAPGVGLAQNYGATGGVGTWNGGAASAAGALPGAGLNPGNGGAGGTSAVPNGSDGGGGGAGVILQGAGQLTANAAITGGNGGIGGNRGPSIDSNGNAGVGVLLVGAGSITTSSTGTITGGSATSIGSGGAGVSVLAGGTIVNAGSIRGGNGGGVSSAGFHGENGGVGSGGALGFVANTDNGGAPGGAGIIGAGLTITNSGTIAGGIGLVSGAQANAITFTGGSNSLELQGNDYRIIGNVDATAATSSTLILGGNSNPAGGFDVSKLVATASATDQYVGFDAFSKTGSSTWTLTGSTTTATPWTIQAGTLAITTDANLGASTSSLTLDGGTLRTDANMTMGRTVTLGAGNGTVDTNGNALTVSGVISGTGKLSKTGTGTLTLTGANTYTGTTTINDGTLALGAGGSLAATSAVNVNSAGAGFDISAAGNQTIGSLAGVAGSNVALGGNSLTFGDASNQTFSGGIGGTGGLTKQGTGTQTLTGANTYRGTTTINAGTLALGVGGSLVPTSAVNVSGAGAGFDISAAGNQTIGSLAGVAGSTVALGANTLTFGDASNQTFAGVIGGSGGLIKQGSGTQTLTGTNIYTGGTTISAGTLALGAGGKLAATGAVNLSGASAVFDISAAHQTIGSLSGVTGSNVNLGTKSLTTGEDNSSTTYAGTISGAGSSTLTKVGGGTMTLTGTSTYGITTVNAGALAIENNGKVSNTTGNIGEAAGSLGAVTVSGEGSNWTNTFDLVVGRQGTGALTVQSGATVSTIEGSIGGGVGSIGTATVSGLGSTWTSSGALVVGNSGTGTLTIEKGGKVSSNTGSIGFSSGGIGHVTVTGAGSTWTNTSNINLSRGTLTVSDGGSLVLDSGNGFLSVAFDASFTGVVNIGGAVGSTAVAAGTVAARELRFGAGNASLNFNHTDAAYTFGTQITGAGVLNQVAGTTILTGANTYSGATTINGGTLRVNGSITSTTTVNSGGTLGGSGTVGNTNIAAGGALAPGNSIGTLNVAGKLSLAPGAIYRVEVDAAGNNDRTNVTGTAALNGTVAVQAAAGSYAANTTYTILNAAGGRTGNFAGVTSNLAFLTPTLDYDANNVFLNLARNSVSFASVATTPNQIATSTALQNANTGATGDMSTVQTALTGLSAEQARAAYDSASGTGLVALRRSSASFAATLNHQMLDRLNTAQGPAAALANSLANRPILLAANSHGTELAGLLNTTMSDAPPQQFSLANGAPLPSASSAQGRGFWLRGSGGYQDIKADGNAAASQQRNTALSAGFDTQLHDGLVVGAALNSSHARLSFDNSDTGKSRGTAVAVYGSYDAGPWAFKASASAGWNDNHMDRAVTVGALNRQARADFNSNTLSAYGEAVYSLPMNGWTLKPVAALSVSRDKADGFSETGAGALNLQVAGQTISSTKSLLGAKASFEAGRVRLEPRVIWAHEFGDLNTPMTAQFQGAASASPFQVSGVALKRDTLILGLGATGSVSKNFDLFADVQLEHNARQRNAGLMLGLRARW